MNAGKTKIPCGTQIRITAGALKGATGRLTHPFGCYGFYDYGAIAGAWLDEPDKYGYARPEVNLFPGDFKVIEPEARP